MLSLHFSCVIIQNSAHSLLINTEPWSETTDSDVLKREKTVAIKISIRFSAVAFFTVGQYNTIFVK